MAERWFQRVAAPLIVSWLAASSLANAATFTATMTGEPGDFVIGSRTITLSDDGSHLSALEYDNGFVLVTYNNLPTFWSFLFQGPNNLPLAPGTYENAEDINSQN